MKITQPKPGMWTITDLPTPKLQMIIDYLPSNGEAILLKQEILDAIYPLSKAEYNAR